MGEYQFDVESVSDILESGFRFLFLAVLRYVFKCILDVCYSVLMSNYFVEVSYLIHYSDIKVFANKFIFNKIKSNNKEFN